MNGTNCPNCGAVIDSPICKYCGTTFIDFANMDFNKPNYIRLRCGDTLNIFKAHVLAATIEAHTDPEVVLYADNEPVTMLHTNKPEINIDLRLRVVDDDDGTIFTRIRKIEEEKHALSKMQ